MYAIQVAKTELESAPETSWCGYTLDVLSAPVVDVDPQAVTEQTIAIASWRNDMRGSKSDNLAAIILAARSRGIALVFVDQVSLPQSPTPSSDAIREFTDLYRRLPAVCCYEPPAGEAVDLHGSLHFFRPWIYRETTEILSSDHQPIHIGRPRYDMQHRNYIQSVRHLVSSGPLQSFAHLLFGDISIQKPTDVRYVADFSNRFLTGILSVLDEKDGQLFGFLAHLMPRPKLTVRSVGYFEPSLVSLPLKRFHFTNAEPVTDETEDGQTITIPVYDLHFDDTQIGSYLYYHGFDIHQVRDYSFHSFIFLQDIEKALFQHIDSSAPPLDRAQIFYQAHKDYLTGLNDAFKSIQHGRLMGVVKGNGQIEWHTEGDIDDGDEVYFV